MFKKLKKAVSNPVQAVKENPATAIGAVALGPGGAVLGQAIDRSGVIGKFGAGVENLAGVRKRKVAQMEDPDKLERTEIGASPEYQRTQIGQVTPMQAAQMDTGMADQSRGMQSDLMSQYQARISGEGPSVAEQQLRMGMESNLASQMAAARSARGGQAASAARSAMFAGAQTRGQFAGQQAMLRAQEIDTAMAGASGLSGQMRGADIRQAGMQADLQQQANLQNMQADLERAIAQGRISADEAKTIYASETERNIRQAQMDQDRLMQDASNKIRVQTANIQAKEAERRRAAQAGSTIFGNVLSTAGKIGTHYATQGAG